MHQLHLILIIFVVFSQGVFFANGLECYKCQSFSASSNCISGSGSPSICDKKYCTIYRQEYLDPVGKIKNFYRSCEDKPTYLNAIIHSSYHRTYYRACEHDFCNTGDGLKEFHLKFSNESSTDIYIVPGVGSGEETKLSHFKLILTLISIVTLLSVQIVQ